ncbi:MAG TPA: helix-turn-helix domain-containing protein [bacterium]|nr:helix-turn-helix domain-containing protein [bacterium]
MENGDSELDELCRVLGRRLAQIRREAGLTQVQLAARLGGTNRGWQQAVSRFERGKAGQQSLSFILDYLRVCGKNLGAVLDVLDEYASRPTILEQRAKQALLDATAELPPLQQDRAENYDIGLRLKAGQHVRTEQDIEKRVRQALKRARAEAWERRLHRTFNEVMNESRLGWKDPLATYLRAYGSRVFGALRRTRKARPVWRAKAIAKLDNWAAEHGLLPEPFTKMKQAVIALFADMERKSELD